MKKTTFAIYKFTADFKICLKKICLKYLIEKFKIYYGGFKFICANRFLFSFILFIEIACERQLRK